MARDASILCGAGTQTEPVQRRCSAPGAGSGLAQGCAVSAPLFGCEPVDLAQAFSVQPPPLDFVIPGFLSGTVGALVAPGATGKSFWALEAAMAIACSVAGGDVLRIQPKHSGRVVYLAGEDPSTVLNHRVFAIGGHLSVAARVSIDEQLTLLPIMGKRLDVMNELQLQELISHCAGARLIVLDTLSRIHNLDENSNGDMSRLVSTLEHVAASTGASVMYLHHVSKGSAREGQTDQQQAARGASALIDNARWCGYIVKMTEDEAKQLGICSERRGFYVRFGISKQNYDTNKLDQWYERSDGGVLVPVDLATKSITRKCTGAKKPVNDDERW